MKGRSWLWTVGFILSGLVAITAGLIALGKRESATHPSVASFLPSGSAAFAELLRRQGLRVVEDRSLKPELALNDLAIVYYVPAEQFFGMPQEDPMSNEPWKTLRQHVRAGGRALVIPIGREFQELSLRAATNTRRVVRVGDAEQRNITWDPMATAPLSLFPAQGPSIDLWTPTPVADAYAVLERQESGSVTTLYDGHQATNRFIDKQENAAVLVDVVRSTMRPGGRVVFAEAAVGNVKDRSLVEMIGPCAAAAWYQIVFLGVVVIYTLGKPFGLPTETRKVERGSRELLDAVAFTLRRGRMTSFALKAVREETNRLLRRWFMGPRDPRSMTAESKLTNDLHRALRHAEAAEELGATEAQALELAAEIERLAKEVAESGAHGYKR